MINFHRKIFLTVVIGLLVLSGIFCYQGIQSMNSHCSTDSSAVWCEYTLSHGTIISDAIYTSIYVLLSAVVLFGFALKILPRYKNIILLRTTESLFLLKYFSKDLNPIRILFSDGIIHPRIP